MPAGLPAGVGRGKVSRHPVATTRMALPARTSPPSSPGGGEVAPLLLVSNFPPGVTLDELRNFLEYHGPLKSLVWQLGYDGSVAVTGYVTFTSFLSCRTLDGEEWMGCRLSVKSMESIARSPPARVLDDDDDTSEEADSVIIEESPATPGLCAQPLGPAETDFTTPVKPAELKREEHIGLNMADWTLGALCVLMSLWMMG